MNILILGNGSRENVIKEKLEIEKSEKKNIKIFILDDLNFTNIYKFCIENNIDLVIPCNEEYLCKGIVDYLKTNIPNINLFGPNKYQAQLEGSKYFCKNIMNSLNIIKLGFLLINSNKYLKSSNFIKFFN